MSYEKRTGPPQVIRFYYVTDEIFNEVSRTTSFKAKSVIREKEGYADFDNIQISADEKNFMKKYFREAMLEVFSTMFKIISGDSVVHDTEFTTELAETVTASYADITDNEQYRTINLDLIDQLIYNALIDFIIYKWYVLKGLKDEDDASLLFAEFSNGIVRIVEKTMALRQPTES